MQWWLKAMPVALAAFACMGPLTANAQRVVLYENSGQSGTRLIGSADWQSTKLWVGEGLPVERMISSDIRVPARGLAIIWSLMRNTDSTLPASHIVELRPPAGSYGSIFSVAGMLARQSEQRRGVPLQGFVTRGAGDSFLIGLSSADADKQRNLYWLKESAWIDIALVLNDVGRAVLSVEKGQYGTRIINDAFSEWGYKNLPPPPPSVPASPKSSPVNPPKAAPQVSSGSGFLLSTTGHVVTNSHVVRSCSRISVRAPGGSVSPAKVLARTEADDLAVLKADMRADIAATLRTGPSVRVGEAIVVFGFPLSGLLASTGNATTGNVTALAGLRDDSRQLQISAPVQPGNSGGPVLDMSGNVLGIVVSKLDALRVARLTDDVPQNINFAIKSSTLVNLLEVRGITYSGGQPGKDLSVPDVVERARAFSVEIRCE
jgi:S1-C subfamily serine protease